MHLLGPFMGPKSIKHLTNEGMKPPEPGFKHPPPRHSMKLGGRDITGAVGPGPRAKKRPVNSCKAADPGALFKRFDGARYFAGRNRHATLAIASSLAP